MSDQELARKRVCFEHLTAPVKAAIAAVRAGDLEGLRRVLDEHPEAANPQWEPEFAVPENIPNDSTPLHCVSEGIFDGSNTRGNDYELAKLLIERGADVNLVMPSPGYAHGTPLISAASYNALGAARALLEGGAQVDGDRGDGMPMAYAMHFGFRRMSELLASFGAKLDFRFAAGLGDLAAMERLEYAPILSDPYDDQFTCERTRENVLSQALYFATTLERYEAADRLLAMGADINAIVPGFDFRCTILHRVAGFEFGEADRLAVIRYLVAHGARLDIEDPQYHSTPLGWARYFKRADAAALLETYSSAK